MSGIILGAEESCTEGKVYQWHQLDLRPSLDVLYESSHKSCIRRMIRHAEHQGLTDDEGRSESLIRSFQKLVVLMRSRKHLPPQPFKWFQCLVKSMGKNVCIRMAFKGDQPVTGILTMNHARTVYYKCGGSDARFYHLGATPIFLDKPSKRLNWLTWKHSTSVDQMSRIRGSSCSKNIAEHKVFDLLCGVVLSISCLSSSNA